jgi:hypothetical protein
MIKATSIYAATVSIVQTLSRRRFLTNSGAVLSGGALALATPYIGTRLPMNRLRIAWCSPSRAHLPARRRSRGGCSNRAQGRRQQGARPQHETNVVDESDPQGATQSITKLIQEQKVSVVVGGTSSANSLAMGAVVQAPAACHSYR